MDYFYLILQTLLFSFGGITIKYSGNAFSPFMTSSPVSLGYDDSVCDPENPPEADYAEACK